MLPESVVPLSVAFSCVSLISCAFGACAIQGAMVAHFFCKASEVGFVFSNSRTATAADL